MKIRQEIAYLGFSKRLTYFNLKFEENMDYEKSPKMAKFRQKKGFILTLTIFRPFPPWHGIKVRVLTSYSLHRL